MRYSFSFVAKPLPIMFKLTILNCWLLGHISFLLGTNHLISPWLTQTSTKLVKHALSIIQTQIHILESLFKIRIIVDTKLILLLCNNFHKNSTQNDYNMFPNLTLFSLHISPLSIIIILPQNTPWFPLVSFPCFLYRGYE